MSGDLYRVFEERFYAPREYIKELRRQYLPFVRYIAQLYPGGQTFDIGCGRGEWLELMIESGFDPYGVDLDEGMLNACLERGLPAGLGNAVSHLESLGDETQAIISAFHVVEHLNFDDLVRVVTEAFRVLLPGGLLIMETPNPENIVVATRNFYLDPTHLRPIPAPLLAFLCEYHLFAKVKTIRLQEDKGLIQSASLSLHDVFSGASPDYGVIAQKAAPDMLGVETADAFDGDEYGLSLEALSDRYDRQLRSRIGSVEALADQAVSRSSSAEIYARQAEKCSSEVEERIRQVEAVVGQAAVTAQQAEASAMQAQRYGEYCQAQVQMAIDLMEKCQQRVQVLDETINAVYSSRSWRITRPIRWVSEIVRSVRRGRGGNK